MPFCIGWVENFDTVTLSCTVKKIEANFCFSIFGKNSKWLPFLGRGKFFENCQEYISTQWGGHNSNMTLTVLNLHQKPPKGATTKIQVQRYKRAKIVSDIPVER